jgi:succinate dehydrogenase / fumarate reductase cytochrome b subunit
MSSLWAVWYHLLGGVRHLIWDRAIGLDLKTAEYLGWSVVVGSFVFTIVTIAILW